MRSAILSDKHLFLADQAILMTQNNSCDIQFPRVIVVSTGRRRGALQLWAANRPFVPSRELHFVGIDPDAMK